MPLTRAVQTTLFAVEGRTKAERERDRALDAAAEKRRVIEQVTALARELLLVDLIQEGDGVAFYEVRFAAETRGWLSGEEAEGRAYLNTGSNIMRSAGGTVWKHVASKHRNSKGRLVAKFKLAPPPIGEVTG